jgi:hypothetical protein
MALNIFFGSLIVGSSQKSSPLKKTVSTGELGNFLSQGDTWRKKPKIGRIFVFRPKIGSRPKIGTSKNRHLQSDSKNRQLNPKIGTRKKICPIIGNLLCITLTGEKNPKVVGSPFQM